MAGFQRRASGGFEAASARIANLRWRTILVRRTHHREIAERHYMIDHEHEFSLARQTELVDICEDRVYRHHVRSMNLSSRSCIPLGLAPRTSCISFAASATASAHMRASIARPKGGVHVQEAAPIHTDPRHRTQKHTLQGSRKLGRRGHDLP